VSTQLQLTNISVSKSKIWFRPDSIGPSNESLKKNVEWIQLSQVMDLKEQNVNWISSRPGKGSLFFTKAGNSLTKA
jgi:hypothetical protein